MRLFWRFIDTIKLAVWLPLVFVFHLLFYLAIGLHTWFSTTILATGGYAVILWGLKVIAERKRGQF